MAEPMAPGIELGDVIDHRPMAMAQALVALLCAAALFVDGYDIQVMALAVPSLSRDWHLTADSFGPALSAVVIGITAGAALLGPLGDRLGRKTMLVAALLAIGVATSGTALATSTTEFVIWRLVTGAALGAGLPNCAALTSEYAPAARRGQVVALMNIASPMGAFAAGFIAPPVLDAFGWRGTFLIGGAVPLLLGLAALLFAPESLKFLMVRRPSDARIPRILRRIAPDIDPATIRVAQATPARFEPWKLIGPEFRARSLVLWTMLTLNMFNLYVLLSWLPTLLEHSGWLPASALRGAVLIQGGGILGGFAMSSVLDRGATRVALATGFGLTIIWLLGFSLLPSGPLWVGLLLLLGAGVSGCQLALNTMSAAYYPPAIKATGVSGALLIGGIGSTLGPMTGAWMIGHGLAPTTILLLLALPALACALLVALMRRSWQAY